MTEAKFQSKLIKKIKERFPGSIVLKNDPGYIQGIPDLIVLFRNRWAALECKRDQKSPHRQNQDYYVGILNNMSYASFVYPKNQEEILNAMERLFEEN